MAKRQTSKPVEALNPQPSAANKEPAVDYLDDILQRIQALEDALNRHFPK